MAYPSVSAPYGLIPINLVGGQVFAGATRQIPINSGSATAIFFGDVVKLQASDAGFEALCGLARLQTATGRDGQALV